MGIAATLGIYVANARLTLILKAAKDGTLRPKLRWQIWIFNIAAYGVFALGFLATLSALGWVTLEHAFFFRLLFAEFSYLLIAHFAYDLYYLIKIIIKLYKAIAKLFCA